MLVITREIGEALIIGDDCKIVILGLDRGQVKIGIQAPKTTPVHREEVYKRIQHQKAIDAVCERPVPAP